MEEKMIFLGTGAAEAIPAYFCNCNYCAYVINRLNKYKTITKETKIYATHINHKHNWTHNIFQHHFDEISNYDVSVAYDKLEI